MAEYIDDAAILGFRVRLGYEETKRRKAQRG
jgi:hypothetical protein